MSLRSCGAGLLELLVVLAIIAMVLLWNLDGYRQFMARQAVDGQLSRVATAIMRMRSEAITRSQSVQVCLANLKRNLDVQGCLPARASGGHYQAAEGVLFFIDSPAGRMASYDSKEARDVVLPQSGVTLHSNVLQYRITPSGMLSVPLVRYTARNAEGYCRELRLFGSGSRQVLPCA